MSKKFVDDNIVHFDSDVEKIQATPAQYISYLQDRGALHLAKEIINNMIDEVINPNSPGDTIMIHLDEITNILTCSDNGRGLPFDKMVLVSTTLQSGSKFTRTNVGNSAGQNGVGLCAVNAMSEMYTAVSYRYGEMSSVTFENGKIKRNQTTEKIADKDKHGTVFSFKPSEFYLNGPCPIKSELLMKWLEKIVHLIPPTVTINFSITKKGNDGEIIKTYKNEKGLYDYIKKITPNPAAEPVHLLSSGHIIEHDKGTDTERFLGLELAFTFDHSLDGLEDSFCNFVNTTDGGVHVDAVRSAITTYLAKKTRESLGEAESKKLDIIVKDAQTSLVLTVFVSTDCHPQFTGQTKEKLGNQNLYEPLKAIALDALDKYFIKNPKQLTKYTNLVKLNAKARKKADVAKKSVLKVETGALNDHRIAKLLPCNNRGKEYKELFLVEGDSAGGGVEDMRDDATQAMYSLKGVPLNTYGKSIAKILMNDEMKGLITALKTNIGDKFDINKLYYNKIIILTDSDVDGARICSLLCLFFVIHMPEIIEKGYLYRALPPLYSVNNNGKKEFVRSKAEGVELTEKRIRNVFDIELNGNKLSSKDVSALLMMNSQYVEEVEKLAGKLPLHPEIVEFIGRFEGKPDFDTSLVKYFPEMEYDKETQSVKGIHEMSRWVVVVDEVLHLQLKTIQKFIRDVNKEVMEYDIIDKKTKIKKRVTLYQLLKLVKQYEPKVIKRFKGLGEMEAEELWETTLNPANRTLIRFTMEDALKAADQFKILHGPDSEPKKKLLEHFKMNRDDFDN